MKRVLTYLFFVWLLCSCSGTNVHIEGRIIGAESTKIYLEKVENPTTTIIDSTALSDKGNFKMSFSIEGENPELYHIVCGAERIPLYLSAGESVLINAIGNLSMNYRVEGSTESELLRLFYQPYLKGIIELEHIASEYASPLLSDEDRREVAHHYGKVYQSIKQAQLKFIIENKGSLAAVYALFQRLVGDQHLFNESSDLIYFRTVAEAIEQSYPTSSYLKSLLYSIESMQSSIELKAKVESASFPELNIMDMYGKPRRLSAFMGRVILLNFWSPEAGNSNAQNADLKEVYTKYRGLGFEVYQVGITTSKPLWINSVQEQRLPWTSVSDMRGAGSQALGIYNVTTMPTSFLIDREGNIVERDVLIDETLEGKIENLLK